MRNETLSFDYVPQLQDKLDDERRDKQKRQLPSACETGPRFFRGTTTIWHC